MCEWIATRAFWNPKRAVTQALNLVGQFTGPRTVETVTLDALGLPSLGSCLDQNRLVAGAHCEPTEAALL